MYGLTTQYKPSGLPPHFPRMSEDCSSLGCQRSLSHAPAMLSPSLHLFSKPPPAPPLRALHTPLPAVPRWLDRFDVLLPLDVLLLLPTCLLRPGGWIGLMYCCRGSASTAAP